MLPNILQNFEALKQLPLCLFEHLIISKMPFRAQSTTKTEFFVKIVNRLKLLTIFVKVFILDV